MTVYVDDMRMRATVGSITGNWSHLMADTDRELHRFARQLGLKRGWAQHPGTPLSHYDVTDGKRQRAIQLGAQPISYGGSESRELLRRKRAELRAAPEPGSSTQGLEQLTLLLDGTSGDVL